MLSVYIFFSKLYKLRQEQELEADSFGYKYALQAGFDPKGCFRLMQILSRLESSGIDAEHPNVDKRIKSLKELKKKLNTNELVEQGRRNIEQKEPLNYRIDKKGGWLRVNNRFSPEF